MRREFQSIKGYLQGLENCITNAHSFLADHFQKNTIKRLAKERPTLIFACCDWLVGPLLECGVDKKNIYVMDIGKKYNCGIISLSPFGLYHDVPNCGWRIYIGEKRVFYATDTGHLTAITAKNYSLYLIEANYQESDLEERIVEKTAAGQYIYEFRVAKYHLSKEQADEWLMKNMGANSRYEYLHGHIDKSNDWGYE